MPLQSVSLRALVVAPIRLALAGLGFGAALLAGSSGASALLAFVTSALVLVLVAYGDPRRRLHPIPADPPEVPAGAVEDGLLRLAASAVIPSTVGVAALVAAALPFEPTMAAVMAGILAGLGVAALVGGLGLLLLERRSGMRLFVERGKSSVLARRQGRVNVPTGTTTESAP